MNWSNIPRNPSTRMLRQFAALCLAFFGGGAIWQGVVRHHPTAALFSGCLAVVLGGLGFFNPKLLRPVFVGWMYAAFPIGWVVSHILLAIVFFGLFTPIGLLFRLLGRDPLMLRRPAAQSSYWLPNARVEDKRRYFRQF